MEEEAWVIEDEKGYEVALKDPNSKNPSLYDFNYPIASGDHLLILDESGAIALDFVFHAERRETVKPPPYPSMELWKRSPALAQAILERQKEYLKQPDSWFVSRETSVAGFSAQDWRLIVALDPKAILIKAKAETGI
jgi:hypothetical protein